MTIIVLKDDFTFIDAKNESKSDGCMQMISEISE